MKMVKMLNGTEVDFEAAVMLMDDELREQIHGELIPDEETFLHVYESYHFAKYHEEFQV